MRRCCLVGNAGRGFASTSLLKINNELVGVFKVGRTRQVECFLSLPVPPGFFLWQVPFSLKSPDSHPSVHWTLFPKGIGNGVDLQEKSACLFVDRCLNQAVGSLRMVSRKVATQFSWQCSILKLMQSRSLSSGLSYVQNSLSISNRPAFSVTSCSRVSNLFVAKSDSA